MAIKLPSYNHQIVQDLAWVIASANLPLLPEFKTSMEQYLPANNWYENEFHTLNKTINELDKQPYPLGKRIAEQQNGKLGHYFESLVRYWFEVSPDIEMICHNKIIQSEFRTLGEIDFIYRDMDSGKTIHMEAACKFYLGVYIDDTLHYIGPSLNDIYSEKLKRLQDHQLVISDSEETIKQLSEQSIFIDDRQLLLKGRLFNPTRKDELSQGWMCLSDFSLLQPEFTADFSFVILRKFQWLGALHNIDAFYLPDQVFDQTSLCRQLQLTDFIYPLCIAATKDNSEVFRFFITPDEWHKKALLKLTQ